MKTLRQSSSSASSGSFLPRALIRWEVQDPSAALRSIVTEKPLGPPSAAETTVPSSVTAIPNVPEPVTNGVPYGESNLPPGSTVFSGFAFAVRVPAGVVYVFAPKQTIADSTQTLTQRRSTLTNYVFYDLAGNIGQAEIAA